MLHKVAVGVVWFMRIFFPEEFCVFDSTSENVENKTNKHLRCWTFKQPHRHTDRQHSTTTTTTKGKSNSIKWTIRE